MARKRNNNKTQGSSRNPKSSPALKDNQSKVDGKTINDDAKGNDDSKPESNSSGLPSSANDPEWYSRDPRLVVDGASIPFSLPFGAKLDFFPQRPGVSIPGTGHNGLATTYTNAAIPGVCTVVLKPSMGYNGDKSSPANVCANALYTHVRYVNSGRKNYDPADLFMYVGAFGDIYSFLVWLIRLYNYAFMYSQRNWYVGRDLILANNVDADNLIANLANFRYWINSIINKISSFCIPGDIYYFKRRVFLYSNVYLENPYSNIKDQLYQFAPEGFYAFGFDANNAGKLEYVKMNNSGGLLTIPYLQAYFEQILMGNITGDEDFGLMSGDILKAYGDNIIHLAQIGEDGGIMPVFDPYVLSQFKNSFVVGSLWRANSLKTFTDHNATSHVFGDIEQSTDGLIISCESVDWDNDGGAAAWAAADNHALSVENPDPVPGDVMEATRLMPFLGLFPDYANPGTYFYAFNAGTEIAVALKYSTEPALNGTDTSHISAFSSSTMSIVSGAVSSNSIRVKSVFKYAPTIVGVNYDSSGLLTEFTILSNLDNTTLISNDILKRLHDIALLSLFYVPGVAKLIS